MKVSPPNAPILSVLVVGDLIDDTDGGPGDVWRNEDNSDPNNPVPLHPVLTGLVEAWMAAFPKARKDGAARPPQPPVGNSPGTSS